MEASSESGSVEPEVQLRERTRERREVEKEVEQSLRMSRKFDKSSSFATDNSCARCGKNVFAIERFQVEGLVFHSGCFTCEACATELTHSDYHTHEHRFYCTQHYLSATKGRVVRSPTIGTPRSEESHNESCTVCGRRVIHFEKIEVAGKLYHRPCFACKTCKRPLDMDAYEQLEGEFFCPLHFVERKQRSPAKTPKKEGKQAKKEEKKAKKALATGSPKPERLFGVEAVVDSTPTRKKSNSPLLNKRASGKAETPETGEKKKKKGIFKQLSRGRKENRDAIRELEETDASKTSVVESLNTVKAESTPSRSSSGKAPAGVEALPLRSLSLKSSGDSSKDMMEEDSQAAVKSNTSKLPANVTGGAHDAEAAESKAEAKEVASMDEEEPAIAVDIAETADEPQKEVSVKPVEEQAEDVVTPVEEKAEQASSSDGNSEQGKAFVAAGEPIKSNDEEEQDRAVEKEDVPEKDSDVSVEPKADPSAEDPAAGEPKSEEHGAIQMADDSQGHTADMSGERSVGEQNTITSTGTEASGSDASGLKGKKSKKKKSKKKGAS